MEENQYKTVRVGLCMIHHSLVISIASKSTEEHEVENTLRRTCMGWKPVVGAPGVAGAAPGTGAAAPAAAVPLPVWADTNCTTLSHGSERVSLITGTTGALTVGGATGAAVFGSVMGESGNWRSVGATAAGEPTCVPSKFALAGAAPTGVPKSSAGAAGSGATCALEILA